MCIVEHFLHKVLSQSLHQLMAVSSFPSFLHTSHKTVGGIESLHFPDKDTINLFIGKCSLHLSEAHCPRTPGAVINSLHRGHANPRGLDFVEALIWPSRQS